MSSAMDDETPEHSGFLAPAELQLSKQTVGARTCQEEIRKVTSMCLSYVGDSQVVTMCSSFTVSVWVHHEDMLDALAIRHQRVWSIGCHLQLVPKKGKKVSAAEPGSLPWMSTTSRQWRGAIPRS